MLSNDLLNYGYHFETIEPRKTVINLLWTGFYLLLIAPVLFLFFLILNGGFENVSLPYIDFSATALNILFIGAPVIYFVLKAVLTALFSADTGQNVKIKSASDTGIPIWVGREAFKVWQIIIIYVMPLIVTYPLLFLAGIVSGGDINLLILIFIITYFTSSDFLLAVYVLFLKARYNAEYVAVKNHVYMLTLYSETYIRRKNYSDRFKIKLNRFKKSIKFSMPAVNLKIILIPLIIAVMLSVSVKYFFMNKEQFIGVNPEDYETYLQYCDAAQPVIKKYSGDIYSDIYHAVGNNAGCEFLAGRNILYCNDNGYAIYFDSEKNSVMRLNSEDKAERLCIYEDCRNNLGEMCGHMPNFVSDGCYSDGVLYGVQSYSYAYNEYIKALKCYIIRYGIHENKMDKLIEFEMGDESAYIRNIFIYSGYLYALVSADDMTQLTGVRIDLEEETACILYSDNKNPADKNKMGDFIYNKNNLFSSVPRADEKNMSVIPVSGTVYRIDSDFNAFGGTIDLGYYSVKDENKDIRYIPISARQIEVYNNYIYYTVDIGVALYGYDTKTSQKEELVYGIFNFSIDDNRLYYGNNSINRIQLDAYYTDIENKIPYLDFINATTVYSPEPGYSLGDWSVIGDCIYALLYSESGEETLCRIKTNANNAVYVLWEK